MSDALKDLIAAVEAGLPSPTNWRNFAAVPVGDDDNPGPILAHRAYHGSLDAAKALHDALLPGCRARIDVGRRFRAWIITPENDKIDAYAENPARAYLLAVLKAYEATHDR